MESINQTLSILTDRTNLAQMQINGLQDDLVTIKSENTSTNLSDITGTAGQVLTLDNSNPPAPVWSDLAGAELSNLSDVDTSNYTFSGGEVLSYNNTTNKWEPSDDVLSSTTTSLQTLSSDLQFVIAK